MLYMAHMNLEDQMRIDEELKALERAMENNTFVFDAHPTLSNQYLRINNWSDLRVAIQILQNVVKLPDDDNIRMLTMHLENDASGESLNLSINDFNMLRNAINQYNDSLRIVVNTLRAHTVSSSPETFWVEVRSASDPTELAEITSEIERTLNMAGQAGGSFKFVGVGQGSDWLGFLTDSALTGIALNFSISLAASVVVEVMKVVGPLALAITLRDDGRSSEDLTQSDIDSEVGPVKDRLADIMINQGVEQFEKHLEDASYSSEVRNQVGASMRATTKAIKDMAESNRAVFEVSESGKDITIEIHGNNNEVTIQQFPDIPRQQDALPSVEDE